MFSSWCLVRSVSAAARSSHNETDPKVLSVVVALTVCDRAACREGSWVKEGVTLCRCLVRSEVCVCKV